MNNHYNPALKKYARELRSESVSRAEKRLWKATLSRNQKGVKFKRQRPISYFIVDFFCQELGLIIEVDGNSHHSQGAYDQMRQEKLEQLGYVFLRFREGDVLNNLDEVDLKIQHAIYVLKKGD